MDNDGEPSDHRAMHNVYGLQMARATFEGCRRLRPDRRPFVLTRAGYAGVQRYAAVWTGDNLSNWEHLRMSIPMLLNMGLSNIPFCGADIGGFREHPSAELFTRWLQLGIFYPFCRVHTAGRPEQDPFSFGAKFERVNRRAIELRYRLLPYFYNVFHRSAETGLPVMRALLLDYPDDAKAVATQDEFLLGDDLLVAPVLKDGEVSRSVYLPKGEWYDFWSRRRYAGPVEIRADAPLDRIPVFARGGAVIPTQQVVEYTDQAPINPLTLEVYPQGDSSRDYYEDDGLSYDYRKGGYLEQTFTVKTDGNRITVATSTRKGSYEPPARALEIKIHGEHCAPRQVESGGSALAEAGSLEKLDQSKAGWYYDDDSATVHIKVSDNPGGVKTVLETR